MSLREPDIPKIPHKEARDTVILWKKGRKKKPDPIHFVYSAWNLVYRYHGGSYEKAVEDVKDFTVRMMIKLVKAAEGVASSDKLRQRLQDGKISLEAASEIAGIKNPELRERVVERVEEMKALDQIQVARFAKKYPHASIEKFGQRVLTSKDKIEKIYMAILPLTEKEHRELKEESKKLGMSWDELCIKIIEDWLNARRP